MLMVMFSWWLMLCLLFMVSRFLILGVFIMFVYFIFVVTEGGEIEVGNGIRCKIAGVGNVRVRMNDGNNVRILINIRYVLGLNYNFILLGIFDIKEY